MSLAFSNASLRAVLQLSEKRDTLILQLQKIDTEISNVLRGGSTLKNSPVPTKDTVGNARKGDRKAKMLPQAAVPVAKKRKVTKRGRRGGVKELILAGLKEAGKAGIAVKHLAVKLGLKPKNIHVWIHTTGKKHGLIEALGKGVYRLEESMGVETADSKFQAPKPKIARKARNAKAKKA